MDGKTTIFAWVFDEGQKDSAHAPQLLIILRRFSTLPMVSAPRSQDGQISRILRRFRLRIPPTSPVEQVRENKQDNEARCETVKGTRKGKGNGKMESEWEMKKEQSKTQ